jgi:hypothetical protein
MRTKTLLAAAAFIAAGVASSMAQSVYSLNVVGYVNVPVAGNNKLTLVSDPFVHTDGNYNITNTVVMPDNAIDAQIFRWAGTAWDNTVPQYYGTVDKWIPDFTIAHGNSFFIQTAPGSPDTTVTFVGEVATGVTSSNSFPVGLSVSASKVPVAERQPGGTVGVEDDVIYTWNSTAQAWDNVVWIYIGGFGWDNGSGIEATTNGPSLGVGSGFVYQNLHASPVPWNRNFTIP